MTLDEILAALAEHVGDDKAKGDEAAKAIREKVKLVSQPLINVGSALKKEETKKEIADLKATVETLTQELDETKATLETTNATKPDVQKLEADLTAKWQKKVDDLKKQLAGKDESLKGALRRGSIKALTAELIKAGIDPEYAKEVLAAKHAGAIEIGDDGSITVKGLDGIALDGDEDAKVAALAADVRKQVAPKWVLTNADSGGGVGSGGRSGSTYDPVKVGTEMGQQERAKASDNKLAFT